MQYTLKISLDVGLRGPAGTFLGSEPKELKRNLRDLFMHGLNKVVLDGQVYEKVEDMAVQNIGEPAYRELVYVSKD